VLGNRSVRFALIDGTVLDVPSTFARAPRFEDRGRAIHDAWAAATGTTSRPEADPYAPPAA